MNTSAMAELPAPSSSSSSSMMQSYSAAGEGVAMVSGTSSDARSDTGDGFFGSAQSGSFPAAWTASGNSMSSKHELMSSRTQMALADDGHTGGSDSTKQAASSLSASLNRRRSAKYGQSTANADRSTAPLDDIRKANVPRFTSSIQGDNIAPNAFNESRGEGSASSGFAAAVAQQQQPLLTPRSATGKRDRHHHNTTPTYFAFEPGLQKSNPSSPGWAKSAGSSHNHAHAHTHKVPRTPIQSSPNLASRSPDSSSSSSSDEGDRTQQSQASTSHHSMAQRHSLALSRGQALSEDSHAVFKPSLKGAGGLAARRVAAIAGSSMSVPHTPSSQTPQAAPVGVGAEGSFFGGPASDATMASAPSASHVDISTRPFQSTLSLSGSKPPRSVTGLQSYHGQQPRDNAESIRMDAKRPSMSLPPFNTGAAVASQTGALPTSGSLCGPLASKLAAVGKGICGGTSMLAARRGSAAVNSKFKVVKVDDAQLHAFVLPPPCESLDSDMCGDEFGSREQRESSVSSASSSTATSSSKANPETLILDLRPHTSFVSQGRLQDSINVCVPSTLLRRPAFNLTKIAETLCSRRDRLNFAKKLNLREAYSGGEQPPPGLGQEAGEAQRALRVLVLDQDSTTLAGDSTIHSLLAKLDKAGYKGEFYWLHGGFAALNKWLESQLLEANAKGATAAASLPLITRRLAEEALDWHIISEDEEADADSEDADYNSEVADTDDGDAQSSQGGFYVDPHATPQALQPGLASHSVMPIDLRSSSAASSYSSFNDADSGFASGSAPKPFDAAKLQLPSLKRSASPSSMHVSPTDASAPPRTRALRSASSSTLSTTDGAQGNVPVKSVSNPIVRPRNLPVTAFQIGSTASAAASEALAETNNAASGEVTCGLGKLWNNILNKQNGITTTANNTSASPGNGLAQLGGQSGSEFPLPAAGEARSASGPAKAAANPFFDNIRQNIESQDLETTLSVARPVELPSQYTSEDIIPHLPPFLQTLVRLSPRSRARKLHTEYFELEQNEQKRLQKVLDWHCEQSQGSLVVSQADQVSQTESKPSEHTPRRAESKGDQYHPFSISAGVEKGHLNRYKNMWPYEHARCKLETEPSPTSGDYINASHIKLRGTRKNYIAAQGPLDNTIEHFWQLVVEQKVSVIIMLTLLAEGGREKCTNYYESGQHGSISVTLREERGQAHALKKANAADVGFFGFSDQAVQSPETSMAENDTTSPQHEKPGHKRSRSTRLRDAIVHRVVEIRRASDPPHQPPHIVRHIQYILWPDFDIPPDPAAVVDVIAETTEAHMEAADSEDDPVLVHCSAGVGRTGTFIAVDTLLDRYRRQRKRSSRASTRSSSRKVWRRSSPSRMDVDQPFRPAAKRESVDLSNSSGFGKLSLESRRASEVHLNESSNRLQSPLGEPDAEQDDLMTHLLERNLVREDSDNPMQAVVEQMREQRMSSVANVSQYVFTHLALLAGIVSDLREEGIVPPPTD